MDHAERLALARRVTDFVLQRHPDVVAVAICGSTAHAEDREWSDLEMFAVTRGKPGARGYGTIHGGIVVEVELVSEEDAMRVVTSVRGDWPVSIDGWLHTIPTHDPEGLVARLAASAAHPDPAGFDRHVRGALVGMYEDLCKMRNHVASGEEAMARFMAPNFAFWGLASFIGHLNRQSFNGTRNLLTKPRDFPTLPPHFWEDYPALVAADGSARDLLARAERMYGGCRVLLQSAGIESPESGSLEDGLERGRSPRD